MPFKKMTPHLLTLIGIKLNMSYESISPCSYNNASINWVYLYTTLLAYFVLKFSRPFFPSSHCISFHFLTAFLSIFSLHFFPSSHCPSFLLLTVLLSFFSLSFFPSSHCPSFLLLTVLLSFFSLSFFPSSHCPSFLLPTALLSSLTVMMIKTKALKLMSVSRMERRGRFLSLL